MELSYLTLSLSSSNLSFPLVWGIMLFLHCLIGLVAARLAAYKGQDFGLWFAWGLLGGTAALITALRLEGR